MATVKLYCGANHSPRAGMLDEAVREAWGRAVLLLPSQAAAAARRETLLRAAGGAWGNPVRQFTDFVTALVQTEGVSARRLPDFERQLLVEQCLHELHAEGRLEAWRELVELPGLAAHLLRVITKLKQAAIEPEDFAARVASGGGLDLLVAEVYARYQGRMKSAGSYDVPGLYWEAELRCRAQAPRLLCDVDLIALDGFDDFTPSEFRLIEALAPHVRHLIFGLNYDTAPGRQDLYTLPRATADRIRRALDTAIIPVDSPAPRRCSEYAAANLFWRDTPVMPPDLQADLRVVPCADLTHEVETIGRRVKHLILEEGVAPDQVAVVFRSLDEVAGPLRAVFSEFQVPLRVQQQPRLGASALGAFLLRLIEAGEGWGREAVLDALLSPWLQPKGWPKAKRDTFPLIARHAQIIAGFPEWTGQLRRLEERLAHGGSQEARRLLQRLPKAAVHTSSLRGYAERFMRLWETLPGNAPRSAHAAAFDALLSELGVDKAAQTLAAEYPGEPAALASARQVLETMALASGAEEVITRAAFFQTLRAALDQADYPLPQPSRAVVCLDASALRNRQFEYVFFGGLNEGLTPLPPGINAVYGEMDLARLHQAGVTLEGRSEHSQRERLFFHHVLIAARKGLTLSWRLTRSGREAAQSHLLSEVLDLFEKDTVLEPMPQSDAFLPGASAVASTRDLRNLVFRGVPGGHPEFADTFETTRHAAGVEEARNAPETSHHDGMLQDPRLHALLAKDFGADHAFSVGQLESYLDCPFSFFQQRVLRLDETEVPEAEFDPMLRGTILHDALEHFHRQFRGKSAQAIPEAAGKEALCDAVDAAFEEHGWKGGAAAGSLAEVERRRMQRAVQRYFRIARENDANALWAPEHFEVAFGRAPREEADALSRADTFALELGEQQVLFSGKVDRIDRNGAQVRLIDYKSGGVPAAGKIKDGSSLQLSVYAMAVEALLLPGVSCSEAWFVRVGHTDACEALRLGKKGYENREQAVLDAIATALRGIRSGCFAPVREKGCCWNCGDSRACRHNQTRLERKGWTSLQSALDAAAQRPLEGD